MKLKILSYLSLTFLISCARFPYTGVISESARLIKANHPEAFKQIENISYIEMGNKEGPLVILIHGSPGSWESWAHFFKSPGLLEKYQIITFDRYGYGAHEKGTPSPKLSKQIEIPKRIIEKLKNDRKVFVVGHSYGGPVAVKLAQDFPELVDGLVLAAASVDPELEKMYWYQYVAENRLIRWLVPDVLDVCNREILGLKDELKLMLDRYKDLKTPTYVIQGEIDKLVPKENADFLKKHIPHAQIKMIPEAKHFLPWSFPRHFEKALDQLNNKPNKG